MKASVLSRASEPRMQHLSPLEALSRELGDFAGRVERETGLRMSAALSDLARREAERDLKLERLERVITEALAAVKNGERGEVGATGEAGAKGERGEAGPQGERGERGLTGSDGAAGPSGPQGEAGPQGERGLQGEAGRDGQKGDPGARGEPGAAGKLPMVRAWSDGVHYEGDVVSWAGETYQAQRDTGTKPPSQDWACLAERGRDGADARALNFIGPYSAGEAYETLDVVALNGGSFVALRDSPGPCPGDGWRLLASAGKRGAPGERGARGDQGDRGAPGSPVRALAIDADGLLTLTNGDGSVVRCDLYPLLSSLRG